MSLQNTLFCIRISLICASPIAQLIKNLPAMQKTPVQFSGLGRPLAEGNGNPLQYSCLDTPSDDLMLRNRL